MVTERRTDRRKLLAAGAAAATGAWVAPSITRLDRVSAAQPSCKQNWDPDLAAWTINNGSGSTAGHWNVATVGGSPVNGRSYDGTRSLHYGTGRLTAGVGRSYASPGGSNKRTSGTATSPTVKMPSSGLLPLTFRLWREVEGARAPGPYDVLTLEVIGSTTTTLYTIDNSALSSLSWILISVTIPATYLNQNVQFRFTFDTMDGTNNDYEGVYIDDFRYPC